MFVPILIAIGILIILSAMVFLVIWHFLAPRDCWFTFVGEGSAKARMRGKEFDNRFMMRWRGHTMDDNYNVIPVDTWTLDGRVLTDENGKPFAKSETPPQGKTYVEVEEVVDENGDPVNNIKDIGNKELTVQTQYETIESQGLSYEEICKPIGPPKSHRWGGFQWFGWWPIVKIYNYEFSWTNLTEAGEVQPHEKEPIDYIILKEDVYISKLEKAEDKDLVPLEITFTLTLRVVNPYKALFVIENWLEAVINRIKPAIRNSITQRTYKELITERTSAGEEIQARIAIRRGEKRPSLLEEFRSRYGIDIRRIEIEEINPGEEYREDTLKEFRAKREAEELATLAKAQAEKRAEEVIAMLAKLSNQKPEEVQQEINSSPELKKEFMTFSQDLVKRGMAIKGKSFLDIRTEGATGVEKAILDWLGAFKRMPMGEEPEEESGPKPKETGD